MSKSIQDYHVIFYDGTHLVNREVCYKYFKDRHNITEEEWMMFTLGTDLNTTRLTKSI
jgi:hypothetical protein